MKWDLFAITGLQERWGLSNLQVALYMYCVCLITIQVPIPATYQRLMAQVANHAVDMWNKDVAQLYARGSSTHLNYTLISCSCSLRFL